jgi:hypothetical protein
MGRASANGGTRRGEIGRQDRAVRAARRTVAALLGLVLIAVTALVGQVAAPNPASASAPLGTVSNDGLGVRDPARSSAPTATCGSPTGTTTRSGA